MEQSVCRDCLQWLCTGAVKQQRIQAGEAPPHVYGPVESRGSGPGDYNMLAIGKAASSAKAANEGAQQRALFLMTGGIPVSARIDGVISHRIQEACHRHLRYPYHDFSIDPVAAGFVAGPPGQRLLVVVGNLGMKVCRYVPGCQQTRLSKLAASSDSIRGYGKRQTISLAPPSRDSRLHFLTKHRAEHTLPARLNNRVVIYRDNSSFTICLR